MTTTKENNSKELFKIVFANGVEVGKVGKMLITDNGKQLFTTAKNLDGVNAEKVAVISNTKEIITRIEMLPTMGLQNVSTLSDGLTKQVIESIRAQGSKYGAHCYVLLDNVSNGVRYEMDEAKQLGEGVGYEINKRGEIIPKVMPVEVRRARGLQREVVACIEYKSNNGEKDLYNNHCYVSVAVLDSIVANHKEQIEKIKTTENILTDIKK